MASARSIDPYTVRYVSLGSGPNERSSKCGCNYRTSNVRRGTCYTTLRNDPPLANFEKQRAGNLFHRADTPLVKCLLREPMQNTNRVSNVRKKRPVSATTCTKVNQNLALVADGLISVKGNNMHYQSRPLGRRASESVMNDNIIQSISNATSEEIVKMSSLFSDCSIKPIPKPPCPSPEQGDLLEMDSSNQGDSKTFGTSNVISEEESTVDAMPIEESDKLSKDIENEPCLINEHSFEDKECFNEVQLFQAVDVHNEAKSHKSGSKRILQFKVPTGQDSDVPSFDINFNSDASSVLCCTDNCPEKPQRIPKCNSELKVSQLKQVSRRPVSANAAIGSAVKAKTIEFIDDKQLSKPTAVISDRTLETLLYMDYLSAKEKSAHELEKMNDCYQRKLGNGDLNEDRSSGRAMQNEILRKQKVKNAPEMKITSKTSIAKTSMSDHENHGLETKISTGSSDEKISDEREERREAGRASETSLASSRSSEFMNEKQEKRTRKILKRTDVDLKERKKQQKNEISMIWRSITGIDNVSNEASKEQSNDSLETHANIAPAEERSSILLNRVTDDTESRKEVDLTLITDNSCSDRLVDRPSMKKTAYMNDSSNKLQNIEDSVKIGEDSNRKTKNSAKQRNSSVVDRKIMRPTSAVILRYMQEKETRKYEKKPRPKSSSTINHKTQETINPRPKSAAVERVSRRNSRTSGVKVIASQDLNFTLKNGKDMSSKARQAQPITGSSKRPISASLSKSKRPISAPVRIPKDAPKVSVLDIAQEEKQISEECFNVLNACKKQGIAISMQTITRALMPPGEFARPYSSSNLPHSSRLLIKPNTWLKTEHK